MSDPIPFKWFTGAAPTIGWDCAFLAPADLIEHAEKYERIPIRGLGKLQIKPGKEGPQLVLDRNLPGMFGAQDINSPGMVDRKLFCWIFEATPAAAADWEESWTKPTDVSPILEGTEADAEVLAAQARQKAQLAKALKGGPQGLVRH